MIELLLLIAGLGGIGGVALMVTNARATVARRVFYGREVAPSRFQALTTGIKTPSSPLKAIPASIQAELDGDPSWWGEKYHQQMLAAGTEKVYVDRSRNDQEHEYAYVLDGCLCTNCSPSNTRQIGA